MSVTPAFALQLSKSLTEARKRIKDLERRNGFLQSQIDSLAPALELAQQELYACQESVWEANQGDDL